MSTIDLEKLKDLFSYHTSERNEKRTNDHMKVNEMCQKFAINLSSVIENKEDLINLLMELQKLRMLTNQSVVNKYLSINYRSIFKD